MKAKSDLNNSKTTNIFSIRLDSSLRASLEDLKPGKRGLGKLVRKVLFNYLLQNLSQDIQDVQSTNNK